MAHRRSIEELDAEISRIEERSREQVAQLRARKRDMLARERARERKMRNHALMVYGGLFVAAAGGNWMDVDPARVKSYLDRYAAAISSRCRLDVQARGCSADEANERMRAFERTMRGGGDTVDAPAPGASIREGDVRNDAPHDMRNHVARPSNA